MKPNEYTSIGGKRGYFQTTRWTAIEAIESNDDACNRAMIGDLLKTYWKPVYCYLRQKGYGNEDAKDLTQGFFHEIVLGRKLIQQADHTKGRFRTLLLTALDRYITSVHRKQTSKKHVPKGKLVQLQDMVAVDMPEPIGDLDSEGSFNYAWISELLDQILEEIEIECRNRGMTVHWQAFRARVLQPIIESKKPSSLEEICNRFGIEDRVKASNMIFTVKKRFHAALRRYLRESVVSEPEVAEEMQELMRFLSQK